VYPLTFPKFKIAVSDVVGPRCGDMTFLLLLEPAGPRTVVRLHGKGLDCNWREGLEGQLGDASAVLHHASVSRNLSGRGMLQGVERVWWWLDSTAREKSREGVPALPQSPAPFFKICFYSRETLHLLSHAQPPRIVLDQVTIEGSDSFSYGLGALFTCYPFLFSVSNVEQSSGSAQ